MSRFIAGICLAALLALAGAPAASGSATIGQFPAVTPPPFPTCSNVNYDSFVTNVGSGTGYVVPPAGFAITSWSHYAAPGAEQKLKMKVFRKVAEPSTYAAVGHHGPVNLTPSALNTFEPYIPVQPGDIVGLNQFNTQVDPLGNTACQIENSAGNLFIRSGDLSNDASGPFILGDTNARLNLQAVVAVKASSDFELGKLTRNKNKGTATLAVDVPGPGELSLTGKGVKKQRAVNPSAVTSKTASAAGTVTLRIKARGKRRERLLDNGKVKLRLLVNYKPAPVDPDAGDIAGDPSSETRTAKLVKN